MATEQPLSGGENFQYHDEFTRPRKGWFPKPRGLVTLLERKQITKNEYCLMDYLLSLENHFRPSDGWFFHPDKKICGTRLISSKKIINARRELKKKGLIDFKSGHSHKATDYRILIPKKYYPQASPEEDSE